MYYLLSRCVQQEGMVRLEWMAQEKSMVWSSGTRKRKRTNHEKEKTSISTDAGSIMSRVPTW